jgi:hypothetical protein
VHSIYRPINEGADMKRSGCRNQGHQFHKHCPVSPKRDAMDSISGPWGNSFCDGIPIMPHNNTALTATALSLQSSFYAGRNEQGKTFVVKCRLKGYQAYPIQTHIPDLEVRVSTTQSLGELSSLEHSLENCENHIW